MPRFPVIQTQVADPARAAQYSAPDVAPVQPQEPQQLLRLGQAMEQAGQQFSALAADRERRINLAAHTEREAAAKEIEIAKFSEFGKLEGKAAVDGFDSYMKEMEKRHEAAIRSAPAGPQREWLQQSLRQQRVQLLNSATSHRDKELRTWRIGGASASLQQSIKTAIAMHGSPDDDSNAQDVADKARELAALQGASDEQTNMLVAQGISDMHVGRVDKMLADSRTAEAATYLASHKNEISQESYDKTEKVTKAAVIEGTARELTSNFYRFEDRLKWVNEKFQGSADDKESLRRHLMQQANLQDAADAQVAADVEKRARQWMAENPELDIMRDAPELAAEVTRYGVDVRRTRTTNQKWLDEFYAAPTSRLDSLRALDDNQLHRYLSSRLDAHDEATVTKFLRGDQSGASIGERTKVLARQLGILPSDNRDARPEENRAFDAWVANTIDPMIRKRRDELKRDLNVDDFQKLIVNPILQDKVWQSVTGRDVQRPLAQFQQSGAAPVDDPLTPQDESQDFSAYNSFYVNVGGQEVYLRDVPLEQRKAIREDFANANPGQQMTVEEEIKRWVEGGRKGDLKPKFDAEKKTAGMVDPAEWPMQIGPSRRDHIWSDGKSIRQGSTAAPK